MTDPRPPALSRGTVDRSTHRRGDSSWLTEAWDSPSTQVLVTSDGAAPIVDEGNGPRLMLLDTAAAPAGERYFLGVRADTAFFAVAVDPASGEGPVPCLRAGRMIGLRQIGADLDDRDAGLLTHAVGLANWHATHRHCPRCGTRTELLPGAATTRCPADGTEHFPRTDPAVVVLVDDGDDACVLGRGPDRAPGRWSALAGCVEPGASAEQAVVREVGDEVGLEVVDARYQVSQPGPFPASLMPAFTARAEPDPLTVDPRELADAAWFSRSQLRAAVAVGDVQLPSPVSVARRLVDAWLAEG